MLCDFIRRALQDELFWGWVHDYEPDITADKLCGKIRNAIAKHEHLAPKMTKAMVNIVEKSRWGKPDSKRRNQKKPSRNGVVMTCTGYVSEEHLFKECRSLNKES